jgi:DNA-directed RNA polymerase alpha subunit
MNLDERIESLNLSTKQAKALRLLGVHTLRQLLSLDPARILALKGYGTRTFERVLLAQNKLKQAIGEPVLSSHEVPIAPGRHPEASTSIAELLGLGTRELHALQTLGVDSIYELLAMPVQRILTVRACGVTTIERVQRAQELAQRLLSLSNDGNLPDLPGEPSSSHENIVNSQWQVYPTSPITDLPLALGARESHALSTLGIETIADLLALPAERILSVRACGATTVSRVRHAQELVRRLIGQNAHPLTPSQSLATVITMETAIPPVERFWTCSCTQDRLLLFPLFSDVVPFGFDPRQIHTTYLPDQSAKSLNVSARGQKVLRSMRIRDIRSLLSTRPSTILSADNCGVVTLDSLQAVVQNFILIANGVIARPALPDHAFLSFEAMVSSWLLAELKVKRKVLLVVDRLGLNAEGTKKTLADVASRLTLTRERVRQIEAKCLSGLVRQESLALLDPLWARIKECLVQSGGAEYVTTIAKTLSVSFAWAQEPLFRTLRHLIELNPDFILAGENVVVLSHLPCLGCEKALSFLLRLIQSKNEVRIEDASDDLARICNSECDTASHPKRYEAYIAYRVERHLAKQIRLKNRVLYSDDQWALRFGPLYLAAAIVLKRKGKAMHFSEVASELQRVREDGIGDRGTHACLDRCEDVMLWDRGTFIHTDHVSFPQELLGDIETWLVSQLRNGVPCMSVSGVFAQFTNECKHAGVISESALYASLRRFGRDVLAYPRYPYIYLRRRGTEHVPAYLIVEDWLRDAEGPVSNKRLKEFVCTEMGMKPFQLAGIKKQVPNVVQNDAWEYLHTSTLTFGKDDVAPLVSHAQRLLSDAASVSAAKIFHDKAVTCHQMGISGPRMLFNVLREFASDELNCNGYPTVKVQTTQEAGKWRGVVADVEAFMKAQGRPCASDEISEEFVEKLGYRPGTVFSVLYRGNVFRYLQGCIVHRDVIEWSDAKQSQLESVLREVYRQARDTGLAYGELDRVIEAREDELPTLGHDILWTATLLADLAGKLPSFAVIGTAENAFVQSPNDLAICSLSDLAAWLLRTEYGGATNHEQFTKVLRSRNIVRNNLTPSMLGDESTVVIAGHEIMLKELM